MKNSWLKMLTLGQKKKMICLLSTLNKHENADKWAIWEEENDKAVGPGVDLAPCKIVQETPIFSAIGSGFKKNGR